jgi:hypothetical protein
MRHALNRADICSEEIDGEVIVINLTTGCYYSLGGSAAATWSMAVAGWNADEIAAHFSSDQLSPEEIEAEVVRFLGYLCAENVLHAAHDLPREEVPGLAAAQAFAVPQIEKFTDMQELMLLDPIHEVSEAGWPLRDPGAS